MKSWRSCRDMSKRNQINPEEDRHLLESDEEDGDSIILWHGTTRSRAKAILRNGFRFEKALIERGDGLTFFSPDPRVARRYARSRAKAEGDRPAVIMCSIDLRRYDNFERRGSEYMFGYECIPRDVIRDIEGLPKRQLEKLRGRKKHSAGLTDVALTFNSGRAGIAYWVNSCLKLNESHRMAEDDELVGKIKQWLDEQMDAGRFGEVPDDEILEQLRKYGRSDYG